METGFKRRSTKGNLEKFAGVSGEELLDVNIPESKPETNHVGEISWRLPIGGNFSRFPKVERRWG
jgi:hypothetical protein